MDNWLIKQQVDLAIGSAPMKVWPDALMIYGDSDAHTWEVALTKGGQPIALAGGSLSAYFIRADDVAVRVEGTIQGNVVSVTLAQACYAVPGELRAVMRLSLGNELMTVSVLMLRVGVGIGDQVVDPGEVIPGIDQLIAKIAAMEAGTKAANMAAGVANQAATLANTRAEEAQTAAAAATSAATAANTQAGRAQSATTAATEAAGLAVLRAGEAQQAAAAANQSATRVETAVSAAETALSTANTAKEAALAAATLAGTRAAEAYDGAAAANSAAAAANAGAGEAEAATADANTAAALANARAGEAEAATEAANAAAEDVAAATSSAIAATGSAETATIAANDAAAAANAAATLANTKAGEASTAAQAANRVADQLSEVTMSVDMLPPGEEPSAAVMQTEHATQFALHIPGMPGPAGEIEIGTVATGLPGTAVSIVNRGTDSQAILDITIPAGRDGSGAGDMIASVYDTNADGRVDAADSAADADKLGGREASEYALAAVVPAVPSWALQPGKPGYTAAEVGALAVDGTAADAAKLGGVAAGEYARAGDMPVVPAWALQPGKPGYTASEVGALAVNGTAADAAKLGGVAASAYAKAVDVPVVPSWALQPGKPGYTPDEVGALPSGGTATDAAKLGGQLPSYYAAAATAQPQIHNALPYPVLSASLWIQSGDLWHQTLAVPGLPADAPDIWTRVWPAPESEDDYFDNGLQWTDQPAGELVYTAESLPERDIVLYVIVVPGIAPLQGG